jgi:hypothetical protein
METNDLDNLDIIPPIETVVPLVDRFAPIPLNAQRARLFQHLAHYQVGQRPQTGEPVTESPAAHLVAAIDQQFARQAKLQALAETGRELAPYAGVALATVVTYGLVQAGINRIPAERKSQVGRGLARTGATLRRLVPRRRLSAQVILRQLADRGQRVRLILGERETVGFLTPLGREQYELKGNSTQPPLTFRLAAVSHIAIARAADPTAVTVTLRNPDADQP